MKTLLFLVSLLRYDVIWCMCYWGMSLFDILASGFSHLARVCGDIDIVLILYTYSIVEPPFIVMEGVFVKGMLCIICRKQDLA